MSKLISDGKNEYISDHENILFTTEKALHDKDVCELLKILHKDFGLKTTIVSVDEGYEATVKNK